MSRLAAVFTRYEVVPLLGYTGGSQAGINFFYDVSILCVSCCSHELCGYFCDIVFECTGFGRLYCHSELLMYFCSILRKHCPVELP